jgi:hypothetical protein
MEVESKKKSRAYDDLERRSILFLKEGREVLAKYKMELSGGELPIHRNRPTPKLGYDHILRHFHVHFLIPHFPFPAQRNQGLSRGRVRKSPSVNTQQHHQFPIFGSSTASSAPRLNSRSGLSSDSNLALLCTLVYSRALLCLLSFCNEMNPHTMKCIHTGRPLVRVPHSGSARFGDARGPRPSLKWEAANNILAHYGLTATKVHSSLLSLSDPPDLQRSLPARPLSPGTCLHIMLLHILAPALCPNHPTLCLPRYLINRVPM